MQSSVAEARSVQDEVGVRNTLRAEVEAVLERLSRALVRDGDAPADGGVSRNGANEDTAGTQTLVRFLGQVLAAWPHLPPGAFPDEGAGLGASVYVEDVDSGSRETYTLMTGPLLDIDAGQVSLASPIGQSLLGVSPGAAVLIRTPQRLRRLRVLAVRTLHEKLLEDAPNLSAV